MLTAHDAYKMHHAALFTDQTIDEILNNSRGAVVNYLENRLIWAELNYYKEKGVLLGKHPIFDRLRRIDEIRCMKIGDLVKLRDQCLTNIHYNQRSIRKFPNHPQTAIRKKKIQEKELELSEINRLLNL